MKTLLAHPGTQHAFRLARELHRLNLLGGFWTSVALPEAGRAARLAGTRLHALRNRIMPEVAPARLHSVPWPEMLAAARIRLGAEPVATLHARNAAFQRMIPQDCLYTADAVIGFDTSGWILAARARDAGKPFFLDRSIAHPALLSRSLDQLAREFPAWGVDTRRRPAAVTGAEQEEHDLAHRIVVGSSFARASLVAEGIDEAKIRVNPYGVEWDDFANRRPMSTQETGTRPLRFLFAGSLLARKGLPILIEAWRALAAKDAELWLVGGVEPAVRQLIPALPGLRILGRVPKAEMQQIYAATDVLVLPSLVEGFSLVLLEAVAAGLRIIATPNTGAGDIITCPALGELVLAGSSSHLQDALQRQIDHPVDRRQVCDAAMSLKSHFTWAAYGQRWAELLKETT